MSLERMSVSLDDFFQYLIKKWYFIVGSILVSGIVFCVVSNVYGKRIEVPPSEEYLYLKEQEASFQDYIDHSIVMKMDTVNIYERTLFVENISDKNCLKDFVESGNVWGELTESIKVQYLSEILTWEDIDGNAEIRVRHNDEIQCGKYAEYLAEQLRKSDDAAKVSIGEQRIVIDESMANRQSWYINRLKDVRGQLEYTAMGYTIEVSMVTAIILGVTLGGAFSIMGLFCTFLFNNKLRSVDEISYYTKADLLAKCSAIREKRNLPVVGTNEFDEMIKTRFGSKDRVLFINLTEKGILDGNLQEIKGVEIEELEKTLNYEYIVIGASPNKTVYKELKRLMKFLAENEKEISGCIAC